MTRVSNFTRTLLFSTMTFCLLCATLPAPAHATSQEMRLTSFRLSETDGALMLTFGVGVTQLDQLRVLLNEGVLVELNCQVDLSRPRSYWFRKNLAETNITSQLYYDTLTKEYFLTLPDNKAPHRNKSLRKLLEGAWKSISLPVGSTTLMTSGNEYRVTLSVEMVNTDVPEWLSKSFFFWSWDPAPPIQYSTDFTY
ncbi:DUF4390 domain-containing protein [Halodesulfovibrio marinisediminis]|uniref:DUF4390 domain-containing protein n=1 Tax=Halodesulfovibrio marinisediminis DSM 17456 TaxID=1121457 RepID=A0A1N6FRP6_9BACT|nr:DUF4390 domain-containing protein [Halodesulfovibrio marinisediminis]SIN98006.1 protein of unknown function [Halodesulfovibrio marinisediminis DSM 17456]